VSRIERKMTRHLATWTTALDWTIGRGQMVGTTRRLLERWHQNRARFVIRVLTKRKEKK